MPNSTRRQFLTAASALASASTLGFARPALAQRWPAQDIHFVTGTAAGSGGDVIVRYFAEKVRPLAGRTILVENRVGALGGIATEYAARSKADGYTILIWGGGNIASMMALRKTDRRGHGSASRGHDQSAGFHVRGRRQDPVLHAR